MKRTQLRHAADALHDAKMAVRTATRLLQSSAANRPWTTRLKTLYDSIEIFEIVLRLQYTHPHADYSELPVHDTETASISPRPLIPHRPSLN